MIRIISWMAQTNEEDTDWHYAPPTTDKLDAGCLYMSRYRRTVAVQVPVRVCVRTVCTYCDLKNFEETTSIMLLLYRHCRAVVPSSQNHKITCHILQPHSSNEYCLYENTYKLLDTQYSSRFPIILISTEYKQGSYYKIE